MTLVCYFCCTTCDSATDIHISLPLEAAPTSHLPPFYVTTEHQAELPSIIFYVTCKLWRSEIQRKSRGLPSSWRFHSSPAPEVRPLPWVLDLFLHLQSQQLTLISSLKSASILTFSFSDFDPPASFFQGYLNDIRSTR